MSNNNNSNTFVGYSSSLTGNNNTAFGYSARFNNTTGSQNTAFGYSATQPMEPLTAWYKAAVNARGLTPHIPTKDGNSKT
jgi:hypothetical protein